MLKKRSEVAWSFLLLSLLSSPDALFTFFLWSSE
jgi:hypothetical protein